MDLDDHVDRAVDLIMEKRRDVPAGRSVLAAVSGIDASGKGYVSTRIAGRLESFWMRTAVVSVDG